MELGDVTAYARERLGMEVQAATLLRTQTAGRRRLEVWWLMTERGYFWLVEGGSEVELFRAAHGDSRSTAVAVRQFLQLHPEGPAAPAKPRVARPVTRRTPPPGAYDCRTCGARVTPRQRNAMVDRQLCRRCHRAERARERYRDDPGYRAHLLVARRAQRRGARGMAAS